MASRRTGGSGGGGTSGGSTPTNLSVGLRDTTGFTVQSSSGSGARLPQASDTLAGLLTATEHAHIGAIPQEWVAGTFSIGDQRVWAGKLYRCILARTAGDASNPAADTTGWAEVGTGNSGTSEPTVPAWVTGNAWTAGDLTRVGSAGLFYALTDIDASDAAASVSPVTQSTRSPWLSVGMFRGGWGGNGAHYLEGHVVIRTAGVFICLQTHTASGGSPPESAPTQWAEITVTPAEKGVLTDAPRKWEASAYAPGDQVLWNSKIYECLSTRQGSDTDNPATDTTGWRPLSGGSSGSGTTNLSVGTRTGTTFDVDSSTGTAATIPAASATEAGGMPATAVVQLAAHPLAWTDTTYVDGDQRAHDRKLWECIDDVASATGLAPPDDSTHWKEVGETNLSVAGRSATGLNIRSDTGSNASVPAASTTRAGLASAADKTQLTALPVAWAAAADYTAGGQVASEGSIFEAIVNISGDASNTAPGSDTARWRKVSGDSGTVSGLTAVAHTADLTGDGTSTSQLGLAAATIARLLSAPTSQVGDAGKGMALNAAADAWELVALWGAAQTNARITALVSEWARGTGTVPDASIPSNITRDAELTAAIAGFLSQTQVDARVAAGVLDWAEAGNTSAIPDTKIPAAITRDTELTTAIADFRTMTQIASQITTALAGYLEWKDGWDAVGRYKVGDVVRHVSATWLCISAVNTGGGTTEPGVGAAYANFWRRIGFQNGNPSAYSGAAFSGTELTLRRVGGSNPTTVDLASLAGGGSGGSGSWSPSTLAQAEFDLNGNPQNVALVDSSNDPIIAPASGFLVVTFDVPQLGLRGDSHLIKSERLRLARASTDLTAGLYTDATSHQIHFEAGDQPASSTGNTILIEQINADSSAGILPSIQRFNVTGDASVPAGNIGGRTYGYDLAISQAAHASSARIVGYIGTSASRPNTVHTLKTVSTLQGETGTVTLPDPTTLTANQVFTIELQVFATGESANNNPKIYHDFQITAHAVSRSLTQFLRIPIPSNGATTDVDESDVTDFTNSVAQARADWSGAWTAQGLPDDGTLNRLAFFIPSSDWTGKPTFTEHGIDVSAQWETGTDQTISGTTYKTVISVSDATFDDFTNGSTWTLS